MMKKITSLNVSTGPECSYTFLHLTLQEYMAALYIAISGRDDGKLIQSPGSVVMRFFAGICRHVEYRSHALYQELVQVLGSGSANDLVHCVYECPSIMDSVELDYSKYKYSAIVVTPSVGFDWYVTGYCISHFDVRWGLGNRNHDSWESGIDLFLQGIGSSPKGRIQCLYIPELSLSQVFAQIGKFCRLFGLVLSNNNDFDVKILQQLIAPGRQLRFVELELFYIDHTVLKTVLDQSSLEHLILTNAVYTSSEDLMFLPIPHKNTNLKRLTMGGDFIKPLAALLPKITSLTYLRINDPVTDSDLLVLIDLVQSHDTTLEVLKLGIEDAYIYFTNKPQVLSNLPRLIEAAKNCQITLEIDEKLCKVPGDDYPST